MFSETADSKDFAVKRRRVSYGHRSVAAFLLFSMRFERRWRSKRQRVPGVLPSATK